MTPEAQLQRGGDGLFRAADGADLPVDQNARLQDASAVATLGDGTQHSVLQQAGVFDRLSSFRGTVQGLVVLNQQMKVK